MSMTLSTIDAPRTLKAIAKNAKGTEMAFTDVPQWSISDANVASLAIAADGLSCVVTPVAAGSAVVTLADSGFTATDDITVTAAPIASIEIVEEAPAETVQPQ